MQNGMIIEANQASISRVIFVKVMESVLDHENVIMVRNMVRLLQKQFVKLVIVKTYCFHFVCLTFFVCNWRIYKIYIDFKTWEMSKVLDSGQPHCLDNNV